MQVLDKSGERGRNRTYNLLIKSQLLCQLSYAPTVGNGLAGQTEIIAFAFDLWVCVGSHKTLAALKPAISVLAHSLPLNSLVTNSIISTQGFRLTF